MKRGASISKSSSHSQSIDKLAEQVMENRDYNRSSLNPAGRIPKQDVVSFCESSRREISSGRSSGAGFRRRRIGVAISSLTCQIAASFAVANSSQ